jgi:hypothetical protein
MLAPTVRVSIVEMKVECELTVTERREEVVKVRKGR